MLAAAVGIAATLCMAIYLSVRTPKSAPEGPARPLAQQAATQDAPLGAPPDAEWWTPPKGPQHEFTVPAYAVQGVDTDLLGAVYDAKLRRISNADPLFEMHLLRRVARDEVGAQHMQLRSRLQLSAGYGGLIEAGVRQDRFYYLYRAHWTKEVVGVDETKRMREPPPEAVFYLAAIHYGSSFDVLIEGSSRELSVGANSILRAGAHLEASSADTDRRMYFKAQGYRPVGDAPVFALTPGEISAAYERTSDGVPMVLTFRQIPGRKLPKDEITWPETLHDEEITLNERGLTGPLGTKTYPLKQGTYSVSLSTSSTGIGVAWSPAGCRTGTFKQITTVCRLPGDGALTISNPSELGGGSAEVVKVYIAKGRDPSARESHQSGK